jgi:hypothetical protein
MDCRVKPANDEGESMSTTAGIMRVGGAAKADSAEMTQGALVIARSAGPKQSRCCSGLLRPSLRCGLAMTSPFEQHRPESACCDLRGICFKIKTTAGSHGTAARTLLVGSGEFVPSVPGVWESFLVPQQTRVRQHSTPWHLRPARTGALQRTIARQERLGQSARRLAVGQAYLQPALQHSDT